MPGRKHRRESESSNEGWVLYLLGISVALGAVAGFVLPFVDGVIDFVVVNIAYFSIAAGMLAGVLFTLTVEGLFGAGRRGAGWLWRRLGFGSARTAEPNLSASNSPLVDNLHPGNATGARLERAMVGARRLDICVSYINREGLARLADWLDRMDKDARVRLLIGMAADGWDDRGKDELTTKAVPYFLAQHFRPNQQYDQDAIPFLERLARHQTDGRLEMRVRHPRGKLHAKLYIWTDADGRQENMIGSSNLTGPGLGRQGELNAYMRKSDSTRYFVAWFDARWQEKDSVGGPKLVEDAQKVVAANRPDRSKRRPRASRSGQ